MQLFEECLTEIDDITKTLKCAEKINPFKTLGYRNKKVGATKQELLNKRMYQELYSYKLRVH
jgi:hypothetical protein